jgi:S-adenosylmethionine hydrolase
MCIPNHKRAECPTARISDLSHRIQARNIHEAAYIFTRSVSCFSKGSIHVVVVDPGVGTNRRPRAARIGDRSYVGPDHGTVTGLIERVEQIGWQTESVELNRAEHRLKDISDVFHGRDIFSPVAGHLANGIALSELGASFNDPVRLQLPKPEGTKEGWRGEVTHIDHFGNISTNIRNENLGDAIA